jgi:hypothetical protein
LKYYKFIESIKQYFLKNYIIKKIEISLYKYLIEYIKKFIIDSEPIILKNIDPFMLIRNEIEQNIIKRKVIENSLEVSKQLTGPKLSEQDDWSNFNMSFIKKVNTVITKNNTVLTFDENDISEIIQLFNTLDDIKKETFLNVVIYHNLIGESGRNIEKYPILIIIYYYFIESIEPSDEQIKTIINNIKESLYINLMNYIESYIIKDDLTIPQNNSLFINIRDTIETHFILAKEIKIFEPVFIESNKGDNSTIVEATDYQQKAYYEFFDITEWRNVGEGENIYDDMKISYKRKDQPSDQPSEVEFKIRMKDGKLHSFTIKEFTDQIHDLDLDLDYESFVVLVNNDGTENILSKNSESLTTHISEKNKPIN